MTDAMKVLKSHGLIWDQINEMRKELKNITEPHIRALIEEEIKLNELATSETDINNLIEFHKQSANRMRQIATEMRAL